MKHRPKDRSKQNRRHMDNQTFANALRKKGYRISIGGSGVYYWSRYDDHRFVKTSDIRRQGDRILSAIFPAERQPVGKEIPVYKKGAIRGKAVR